MVCSSYSLHVLILLLLILASATHAEEGGSGHYMPGSMASFMDGVPAEPGFIARLNYLHYSGSTGIDRSLPIAGLTVADVDAVSDAFGLTLLWAPDWKMGENWSYAMSATIPWLSMEVEASLENASFGKPQTIRRSDRESGLGDIIVMPLMLNQKVNPDLNLNYRLAIYAPTGDYEVGRLANTGKNFWTIEPTAALMYFGQKTVLRALFFWGRFQH